jgi:hypothetical protein
MARYARPPAGLGNDEPLGLVLTGWQVRLDVAQVVVPPRNWGLDFATGFCDHKVVHLTPFDVTRGLSHKRPLLRREASCHIIGAGSFDDLLCLLYLLVTE